MLPRCLDFHIGRKGSHIDEEYLSCVALSTMIKRPWPAPGLDRCTDFLKTSSKC